MGEKSKLFFRIVEVLLLLTAVYLLFTVIEALDRLRSSNVALMQKLETLSRSAAPASVSSVPQKAAVPAGNIANVNYFSPDARFGGTLASVLMADPPGFNPLTSNEASSRSIYSLCSSTLAERDWQHPEEFKPLMAESWEISGDRKSYTVKLRKNMMWQRFTDPDSGAEIPPHPITAHDFKFTCDTIMDPDVNCASMRPYYQDLVKVTVVNDHEIVFQWNKEYYGSLASTLSLFPLPRHFYMKDGKFDGKKFNNDHKRNRMIVGCGPYRFVSWEKDRKIVLQSNPDYFGKQYGIAPPLETRVFEIIKHPNTQFQALLGSRIDMLSLSPEQWTRRTDIAPFASGALKRYRYPGSGYTYIGYNQQNHCFTDKQTRQALTMLIDRQKILKEVLYGCAVAADGPFAPGSIYCDKTIVPWKYDPARAKQLLRQAGWRDTDNDGILERNGKKFEFTMLQISGSSTQARILPMIKEFFAAAGINMKLQTVEWSVYLERLKNRSFDACNLGWTGSIDPDPYQIFHSSQITQGDNFVGLKNPELDRAIEELRREFDLKKRAALCHRIGRILHDEQPYTFMFVPDALVALRGSYRNVRVFPYGLEAVSFYLP